MFALVGEELGLFGAFLVILAYGAILWSGLRIARTVESRFSALVAYGLTVGVCLQALVHISVVTRLAPPKGMTLPFISDGNTSLLASSLAVGLILGPLRGVPCRRRPSRVGVRATAPAGPSSRPCSSTNASESSLSSCSS